MLLNVLYVAIASTAFSILFNVRGLNLLFSGICSALGYFVYLFSLGLGSFIALLLASTTISLAAEVMARLNRTPSTLFLISGLIPLVPGGELFQFFVKLLEGDSSIALRHFLTAIMQAGALACGIVLVLALLNLRRVIQHALQKNRR